MNQGGCESKTPTTGDLMKSIMHSKGEIALTTSSSSTISLPLMSPFRGSSGDGHESINASEAISLATSLLHYNPSASKHNTSTSRSRSIVVSGPETLSMRCVRFAPTEQRWRHGINNKNTTDSHDDVYSDRKDHVDEDCIDDLFETSESTTDSAMTSYDSSLLWWSNKELDSIRTTSHAEVVRFIQRSATYYQGLLQDARSQVEGIVALESQRSDNDKLCMEYASPCAYGNAWWAPSPVELLTEWTCECSPYRGLEQNVHNLTNHHGQHRLHGELYHFNVQAHAYRLQVIRRYNETQNHSKNYYPKHLRHQPQNIGDNRRTVHLHKEKHFGRGTFFEDEDTCDTSSHYSGESSDLIDIESGSSGGPEVCNSDDDDDNGVTSCTCTVAVGKDTFDCDSFETFAQSLSAKDRLWSRCMGQADAAAAYSEYS